MTKCLVTITVSGDLKDEMRLTTVVVGVLCRYAADLLSLDRGDAVRSAEGELDYVTDYREEITVSWSAKYEDSP